MPALRHLGHKRHLFVVIDALDLDWPVDVYASLLELSLLLQLGKPTGLFEFLLAYLSSGFLTFSVCKAGSTLLKHLFLVFVHVNRVRS